jgi:CO/xanthine dehydrogenase FAD-binding subunit
MIPQLKFIRPQHLEEALDILAQHPQEARLLAGGTDIMPGFHQQSARFKDIKMLVDINRLDELRAMEKDGNGYKIGAAATFTNISNHPDIEKIFPVLTKAASSVGSVQVRNRATIGGNFINNAPCADTVPPLLAYGASIAIRSAAKTRQLPLEEFLEKPYKTQLKPGEIVTHILLPLPGENMKGDFYKLGRRRGVAISRISLALLADVRDCIIHDLRIAGGAVTPIGIRFKELEKTAKNRKAETALFKQLAQQMGKQVLDMTGLRWSSPYKLPVVQQAFYQLLEQVCGNPQAGPEVRS